jgi:uncharacterized protein YqgQ
MLIDIKYDSITLNINPFAHPDLTEFLNLGIELDILSKYNEYTYFLNSKIAKNIKEKNGSIYISKFWASHICKAGGMSKKPFVRFQIMAYELRELYECGLFDLKVFAFGKQVYPNLDIIADRDDRDTKEMIKFYKKTNPTKTLGCDYNTSATKDNHTKLCCVCGNKDILLLNGEL